jgi:hypothetical protein
MVMHLLLLCPGIQDRLALQHRHKGLLLAVVSVLLPFCGLIVWHYSLA